MPKFYGSKVVATGERTVIAKYDAAGKVADEIEFRKSLQNKEREQRVSIQKGLFDVAANIPGMLSEDPGGSIENQRKAYLQAEETYLTDEYDGLYNAFSILHPPVDMASMVHLTQSYATISPLVEAMKNNIEGFGHIYIPTFDFEDPRALKVLRHHLDEGRRKTLLVLGIDQLKKGFEGRVDFKKAASTDPMIKLAQDAIMETVPFLKHRGQMVDMSDLHLAVQAFKNGFHEFMDKVEERDAVRIEKVRERSFSTKVRQMQAQKETELILLQNFFANCHALESFVQIRKKLRDDYERIGAWTLEVYRDPVTMLPKHLGQIPMVNMRLTAVGDVEEVLLPIKINGIEVVDQPIPVAFRRFVQSLDGGARHIWFREMGDPRIMDKWTGRYVGRNVWNESTRSFDQVYYEDSDSKTVISKEEFYRNNTEFVPATEVLYHALYNAMGSPYPVPRWFGALTLIQGLIANEEVNASWFDNNLIPPMMIKVSEGTLSARSEERIKRMLEVEKRGRDKYFGVLVLEAESKDRVRNFANTGRASIEIEKLRDVVQQDATHTSYDEMGRLKIRASWRVPPALSGQESQFTRQSIMSSKVIAEEQVFQPERADIDDVFNKRLLPALRINHWQLKSNGPPVADNLQMAQVLSLLGKAGFLPVGEARQEVEMILNRPLSKFPEQDLTEKPFPLVLIETKAEAEPADSRRPAPEDAMGARPDKDGYTTDSSIVKSVSGLPYGAVVKTTMEDADQVLDEQIAKSRGAFLVDEDQTLYFVFIDKFGSKHHFRRE